MQDKARQEQYKKQPGAGQDGNPPQRTACKIIYCSRTHSQLQQVVRELDKTSYSAVKCDFTAHFQLTLPAVTLTKVWHMSSA